MPKLSLSAKDAVKGGNQFHAMEGFWEIGDAYSLVHQFQPSKETGKQGPPSCFIALDLYKLDANTFERVDDEPLTETLGLGATNTLEHVRPGNLGKPEDPEPEDLGQEVGTRGNSVYVDSLDAKTYDNCGWMKFSNSLIEAGFKAELLGACYLPYLIGTKFKAGRVPGYKNPTKTYKVDPTDLVVADKKIVVFGYEKGGKKGAGKPAAKANAGAPAPAPATPAASGNGVGSEESQVVVAACLAIAEVNKNKTLKRSLFQAQVMTYLMKNGKGWDMKTKNEVMNGTVKDDEWLANAAAENGFVVDFAADGGKGTLEFPAAD